ncbi:MAG: c-type cytochrome [Anaerolineae bacterium]|nr:c-type cytochrome [Anaerolineae bacterium]
MKRVLFWLITFAAILGACLTNGEAAEQPPPQYAKLPVPATLDAPETIAAGRAIFAANCVSCHGPRGDGAGSVRPQFGPEPADLTGLEQAKVNTPQYLFWRVSEGGRVEPFLSRGSIMPAWKYHLTEEERWQVVAYIRWLAR